MDHYNVAVILANENKLEPYDSQCVKNSRFKKLYLDDDILMQANIQRYVNRFVHLRIFLDLEKSTSYNSN